MDNLNGLQISLMTNETRKAFGLPTIQRQDRSIHWNRGKKRSTDCTKPPRQRDSLDAKLPHNKHAGGKTLRKATRRLELRRLVWNSADGKRPGSMKK